MPGECIKDNKKDRFICAECSRSVHYGCTELPAYYIQMIVRKDRGLKFICVSCVNVTKKIADNYPSQSSQIQSLKRDIKNCENILKVKDETEKELLKKYEDEKKVANTRKKELAELKRKMDRNPALHTLEYIEEKMESKMEKMKENIEETIKSELKTFAEKSYAEVTTTRETSEPKQTTTMREAIKEAWREQEAEENDKMRRSLNVIVHGVPEQEQKDDKLWVEGLINDTHSRVAIKNVARLGKPSQEKKRPLLVCFSSEKEKTTLLGNLSSLKGMEKYMTVSITEDLTPDERKTLKKLSDQAKERNMTDSSETEKWRVRGNSKNGFFLIKIQSKTQSNNTTDKKKVVLAKVLTQTNGF